MTLNALAVLFALASALTIAWGTVVKHNIAARAGDSPLRAAARSPWWWAATASALLAYAFQLVALSFGTLLIVQPVLVLSLMFTLVLSAAVNRKALSLADLGWSGLLTAAVGVLTVVGLPTPGTSHPTTSQWLFGLLVGAVVMLLLYGLARGRGQRRRAVVLGVICGAVFGYLAVASKMVADVFARFGVGGVLTSWPLYSVIGLAVVGTIIQQYAFHAGPLRHSLPAMKITEPLVAFVLGYLVLGESFSASTTAEYLLLVASVVAMVVAAFALARRSA